MKPLSTYVVRAVLALATAIPVPAQPPAIFQEGVFNAASRIPPSLPGGAIAPGSRIVIRGVRFSNASKVRIGGREARILAVTSSNIEALVPPAIPSGHSEVTVSNEDGVSRPFRLRIASASLGIFSENGKSWGPAKTTRPFLLTGTGLGDVRNPEIFVAGKAARVVRAGPLPNDPGTDEIAFVPPAGAPQGCYIPVTARIPGGPASNTVTIPLGRCEPAALDATIFLLLTRIASRIQTYSFHDFDFTQDVGAAAFAPPPVIATLLNAWRLQPPPNTCTAYTGPFFGDPGESSVSGLFAGVIGNQGRNAGDAVTVRNTKGSSRLIAESPGYYHAMMGANKYLYRSAPPLFLMTGAQTVSWEGASTTLEFPAPFHWTNAGQIETIDRSAGVTVEWKSAGQPMAILAVNVDTDSTAMGAAFCVATGNRFTIPPLSLANLPATTQEAGLPLSLLLLAPLPELKRFETGNGEHGVALAANVRAQSVTFK